LCFAKNYPKRKNEIMVNITKQEICIEETLKRKINFICEFVNTTPTIINESIRKINKTNLILHLPTEKKLTLEIEKQAEFNDNR